MLPARGEKLVLRARSLTKEEGRNQGTGGIVPKVRKSNSRRSSAGKIKGHRQKGKISRNFEQARRSGDFEEEFKRGSGIESQRREAASGSDNRAGKNPSHKKGRKMGAYDNGWGKIVGTVISRKEE